MSSVPARLAIEARAGEALRALHAAGDAEARVIGAVEAAGAVAIAIEPA